MHRGDRGCHEGYAGPKFREKLLGHAEVRRTIRVPSVGTIAGCYITDGKIARSAQIRIVRDGVVIQRIRSRPSAASRMTSSEVAEGTECGVGLERFNDIKEGDVPGGVRHGGNQGLIPRDRTRRGQTAFRIGKKGEVRCEIREIMRGTGVSPDPRTGRRYVLMIRHKHGGHRSFPKGHVEAGETEHETAIREVEEETAVRIRITSDFCEKVHYSPMPGVSKEVVYFLSVTDQKATHPHDGEIADVEWVPLENAGAQSDARERQDRPARRAPVAGSLETARYFRNPVVLFSWRQNGG